MRIARQRLASKDPGLISAAAPPIYPIYAAFANDHVSICSESRSLLWYVARNVEPMLTLEPTGTNLGTFYINQLNGGFTVHERDSSEHRLRDLQSAVRSLHHLLIKRFIDSRPDLLWIHAGAVAFAGEALILVARSGQGKSTLVGEFLEWGCSYLSDEIAPIDPVSGAVLPFPVSPWKRITMGGHLPLERLQKIPKVPMRVAPTAVGTGPIPLRQIYFLCHN